MKFVAMNSESPTVERGDMFSASRYRLTYRDGHGRMHLREVTAASMSIAGIERRDAFHLVKIERIDPENGAVLGGRYTE